LGLRKPNPLCSEVSTFRPFPKIIRAIHKEENALLSLKKILAYAWPFLVILLLVFTYVTAPHFYVSYIFQIEERELQLVEILTFLAAGMAGGLLLFSTWKFWKAENYWAAGLVGLVALAALFFAGEEISWGQNYLQWTTPTWWGEHFSGETNLHNSSLPVHQLSALFILSIFFLFPFSWKFRTYLHLPLTLEPVIPEGPVISAIGIAFLFRELKGIYREFAPLWYREVDIPWIEPHDQFYQEFLWGMNEYREMMVALALLMYAGYRLAAAKRMLPQN
jgi:hypothetical protein